VSEVMAITTFIVGIVCMVIGFGTSWAAYRNGVTDGYGYAKEPTCPGYKVAGEFLKTHMAHRWPELKDK
jgi:hypothetical protein